MNLPVLDVNLMLAPAVSGGVDPDLLERELAPRFRAAHADV